MCWMCDDPTMTKADALARMARLAEIHGWAIQYVEPERFRPAWAYTVGLTPHGLPELVVTGLSQVRTAEVLNNRAHQLLHHEEPLVPGEQYGFEGDEFFELYEVVQLSNPDVHLLTVSALYPDHPTRGLQLVWADDRGRWPWEAGFRSRRGGQPVLGPRSPAPAT